VEVVGTFVAIDTVCTVECCGVVFVTVGTVTFVTSYGVFTSSRPVVGWARVATGFTFVDIGTGSTASVDGDSIA
jgi:hypothetical protein